MWRPEQRPNDGDTTSPREWPAPRPSSRSLSRNAIVAWPARTEPVRDARRRTGPGDTRATPAHGKQNSDEKRSVRWAVAFADGSSRYEERRLVLSSTARWRVTPLEPSAHVRRPQLRRHRLKVGVIASLLG
jgi:hypothetical protein